MDTIQHSWCRIETWMQHHAPYTWPNLAPGISDRDVQLAEEILGMTLSADFKAFYRIHNGQFWLDLVSHMQLLPLQKVVKAWMEMKQLWKKGVFEGCKPYYFFDAQCKDWETGPIQPVWWHPQWIPFAMDRAGNYCCLDMAPDVGGAIGQIIDWDHDCGPSRTLFPSFQDLLSILADQVESGEYVDTKDGLELRSKYNLTRFVGLRYIWLPLKIRQANHTRTT